MIIFIAMVLIAGIAAYIILSTGSELQIRSGATGRETIQDVSTGLKISTIEGHNSSGVIDKVVIIITPRPGSPDVGLDRTLVEISNTSVKCVLQYSSTYWVDGRSGLADLFVTDAFSSVSSEFGVIVLKDDDSSCSQTTPVINQGDSVMLSLNTSALFNGIPENQNIQGNIIPGDGAWSIISFRTPSAFVRAVLVLQED
jgi:flagellin FlaB